MMNVIRPGSLCRERSASASQTHGASGSPTIDESLGHPALRTIDVVRLLGVRVDVEVVRQVALRVEVDGEDAQACAAEDVGEVTDCGCLAGAAFLIAEFATQPARLRRTAPPRVKHATVKAVGTSNPNGNSVIPQAISSSIISSARRHFST